MGGMTFGEGGRLKIWWGIFPGGEEVKSKFLTSGEIFEKSLLHLYLDIRRSAVFHD